MQKNIVLFCLLFMNLLSVKAQIFKYIDMKDGLSSRRAFSIQQDKQDFIWILTHKGVDRYDGQQIKTYPLLKDSNVIYSYPNQNVLKTDTNNRLWELGENGMAFYYDELKDSFQLAFDLKASYPETDNVPVNATYLDRHGNIWFCTPHKQFIYHISSRTSHEVKNPITEKIVSITQAENNRYFFASEHRLFSGRLTDMTLKEVKEVPLKEMDIFDYIYFHEPSGLLVINSLLDKSALLDPKNGEVTTLGTYLKDINVNNIIPNRKNPNELLIATDGGGVLCLDIARKKMSQFLKEDSKQLNKMNGNIIKDIYMDKANRLWCVIFPIGVTVYSEKYPAYRWIRHEEGNYNSLSHNCINGIMEDSDGDIWFATDNGISRYRMDKNKWTTYCTDEQLPQSDNHIFASLCELPSGNILAGGYMSGIYEINKVTGKVTYHQQTQYAGTNEIPDKYIRRILCDTDGDIWTGGFYGLKCYNQKTGKRQVFDTSYPVTYIAVRDSNSLWIGMTNGLYSLDKRENILTAFSENVGSINMICAFNGKTYVGTYENGLFVIDNKSGKTEHFHKGNTGMSTNNIYTIVPDKNGNILLGTENGLCIYDIERNEFTNWTKEQGLYASNFNPAAGIHTRNGSIILGSNDGLIILPDSLQVNNSFVNRMFLSNLTIMYRNVYPDMKNSPLTKPLDETDQIKLKYNQNTFSLNVSSINFETQKSIFYSWKLEGFYDEWSAPSKSGFIRYTNLSPGHYTLKIRAIFYDTHKILEERELKIIVERPFWLTFWAFLIYTVILIIVTFILLRISSIRRERKISQDKINFFTQAAHDIRTPLTLIKAPLGEVLQKEKLSTESRDNIELALKETSHLTELTDNLINFQKEELYTSEVRAKEVELNHYLANYIQQFDSYAKQKKITLKYEASFDTQNVWLDPTKISSILRNVLSNAFKYTPIGGSITVKAETGKDTWTLNISDTGIGIPKKDQKKMFKYLFRGLNAANGTESGSGIGLLLIYKLIEKHEGKVTFESTENVGTTFHITFPIKGRHFLFLKDETVQTDTPVENSQACTDTATDQTTTDEKHQNKKDMPRILVVEDNGPLRNFIMRSLSDLYRTEGAANGQEGIKKAEANQPDLIISDIMMPVMDGREMCRTLKSKMETSHIPVILLTALGGDEQIVKGLETRADQYLVKPFDVKILKATIHTLLENRRLMRLRFQQAVTTLPVEEPHLELPSNLDDEFMKRVIQVIKDGLGKELNVDILCSAMNMSRTSFYNKIKALTGISPAEFIRNIRMQEAAALLRSRKYTVAEVSDKMGFADPKYFTDTFKKFYGIPPSSYMKNQKKQQLI